jgi:uncharacterized protein
MQKTIFFLTFGIIIVVGISVLSGMVGGGSGEESSANNVSLVNGRQIIKIDVKGGYSPRLTVAKAGVPTTLKMETKGTFDCSSALSIPSMNYRTNLPPSGSTDVEIPSQKKGTVLRGMCSMGMYGFEVKFE